MKELFGQCPYAVLPIGEARRELYERLLPDVRRVAWDFGYAVGVHGTMRRDLDLIACPWIETAAAPRVFVEALARELGVPDEYPWVSPCLPNGSFKPLGRRWFGIHLTDEFGDGPYLDISVPLAASTMPVARSFR